MKKFLIIVLAFVLHSWAHGQSVPGTLSYQGILMQNDGITPLTDGAHTLVFNFYDAGGALIGGIGSRTITVTTTKGLFTCIIGDGTANNAALPSTLGAQQVYIGLAVDGGAELTPRARLTTTAYAYQAQSAYSISDGTVSSNKIVDGAVTNAKLASGIDASKITTGILPNTIFPTGTSGRVAFWNGTNSFGNDAGLFWDNTSKKLTLGTNGYLDLITGASGGMISAYPVGGTTPRAQIYTGPNNNHSGHLSLFSGGASYSDINLYSTIDATTKTVQFMGSGTNYLNSGNVGIGTTSPGMKLDVLSANAPAIRALSGATGSHTAISIGRTGSEGTLGIAALAGHYVTGSSPGDVMLLTESATQKLILNSGPGNATLVVNNGNVGIGTTAPATSLHVTGNANLLRLEGTTHSYIAFYPDGPTTRKAYFGFSNATTNNVTLENEISGGDIILTTAGSGTIGINTTTPGMDLEIDQKNDFRGLRFRAPGANNANYWDIGKGNVNDNFQFWFNGSSKAYIQNSDGAYNPPSDIRLKENIMMITNILPKLLQLSPKTYNFISDPKKERSIGLIAQDVLSIFPETVSLESTGYYSMSTSDFGILSIQGIKELNQIIKEQEIEIDKLKSSNETLAERLAAIEARLFSKDKASSTSYQSKKP
jgi:Chaperone of endosialidase